MNAFDLLHGQIRATLVEESIFEPTKPQEEAIPAILAGENVLLIAPTGTGKTEAASLPTVSYTHLTLPTIYSV